jgi:hypothetical protein
MPREKFFHHLCRPIFFEAGDPDPRWSGLDALFQGDSPMIIERSGSFFYVSHFGPHGVAIEFPSPETDPEVMTYDYPVDMAVWIMNPDSLSITWALVRQNSHFGSNGAELISQICDPSSLAIFKRSLEHIRGVQTLTLTLELKLRLSGRDFEWYYVILSRQNSSHLTVLATNTEEYKRRLEEFKEADEQVRMAMSYSRIRLWYFEDSRTPVRAFASEVHPNQILQLNWTSIKYSVMSEFQESVIDVARRALLNREEISIEVPVTPGASSWQWVRGVATERTGELMGVAVDVTELKSAALALAGARKGIEDAEVERAALGKRVGRSIALPVEGLGKLAELLTGEREEVELLQELLRKVRGVIEMAVEGQ